MTDGLKKAAVSVYALTPDDRDWLLRNLPDVQRRRLENAVAELEQSGVPDVVAGEPVAGLPSMSDSPNPVSVLHAATVDELRALLSEEPDWLVAAVLAHHDSESQARVREALARPGPQPRLPDGTGHALKPRVQQAIANAAAQKIVELRKAGADGKRFETLLNGAQSRGLRKRDWWRMLWNR